MRYGIAVLLIGLMGCQAPDADLSAARVAADPLAGFVSDEPCGWDDPLAYHRYDAHGEPWTSTGFTYYDDQDDTVIDWGRFYVAVHEDGYASLRYYAIDQSESLFMNVEWERDETACVVRVYDETGATLLVIGNPVPAVPIDVENNVDGFQAAEIVAVSPDFHDLSERLADISSGMKRGGI